MASWFPATAVGAVGAAGTVPGVTLVDAEDGVLVPLTLVATTVNVYDVPLVRPDTEQVRAGGVVPDFDVVQCFVPGALVTV